MQLQHRARFECWHSIQLPKKYPAGHHCILYKGYFFVQYRRHCFLRAEQCSAHKLDKPSSNDRLTKHPKTMFGHNCKTLNSKKLRFVDEQCSTCTKIKENINNRNMQFFMGDAQVSGQ